MEIIIQLPNGGIFLMKFLKHFKTITHHKIIVAKHCFLVGIPLRGLLHDLSKYSPTEFIPGAKYYIGTRSPNELEREDKGYSEAWMHHKGRNRHHFEYWTDYNPVTKMQSSVEMPLVYVKEMFCDRVAAGKIYLGKKYTNDNPIEYFMRGNARKIMHPKTAELLGGWLEMLQKEGEKTTFKHIRKIKKI